MFDWDRHQVCLAEGPDECFALLAIRPARVSNVNTDGETVESETVVWDDGGHQRAFPLARVITDDATLFRFEDDRGQVFTLRPLTARLYAEHAQAEVAGPVLTTDEAVREFYLAPRPW